MSGDYYLQKRAGRSGFFGKKFVFLFMFLVVFLVSFVAAATVEDDLHLNIQTTDTTGNVVTGTFDFVFNITTDSGCSNVVYTDSVTLTTDVRGIVSHYLNNVDLGYDDQYYLCYYRDGSLINSSQIARTPYAFRAKYVNVSGIEVDQNFDLTGFNFTSDYLFGNLNWSFLQNIPDYILEEDAGNLNVNNSEFLDSYDSSFFMPLNNSVYGQFDFNENWTGGGLSIIGGNIYSQEGYFSQISALQGSSLNVNGSLIPVLNNQFDVGNSTMRWNDGYFGGDLNLAGELLVTGTGNSYVMGNLGIGTSSPDAKLFISGGVSETTDAKVLSLTNRGDTIIRTWDFTVGGSGHAQGIYPLIINKDTGGNLGNLVFEGDIDDVIFDIYGNVGIGISDPETKLHLDGNLSGGKYSDFTMDSNKLFSFGHENGYGTINWFSEGNGTDWLNTDSSNMASMMKAGDGSLSFWTSSINAGLGNVSELNERMVVDSLGNVGIGITTPSEKLDVNGSIKISDANGNLSTPELCLGADCRTSWPNTADAGGWSSNATDTSTSLKVTINNDLTVTGSAIGDNFFGDLVGITASSYNGNLSTGVNIGYVSANALCDAEYAGSHFCLKSEILKTISNGNYTTNGTAWFQNGPPGYTANADDCSGWTTDSNTYLGPFWNWDANTQAGRGALTNCAQTKPLMCCGGTN